MDTTEIARSLRYHAEQLRREAAAMESIASYIEQFTDKE